MAFDYAALRDGTAKRLIDRFGQAATLKSRTAATVSPTGTAAPSYTDTTVQAVSLEHREHERPADWKAGDRKVLVEASRLNAAAVTDIGSDDVIVIGGIRLNIMSRERVAPAGVVVLYKLHCREL